jgi:uncharacterized membrane protein
MREDVERALTWVLAVALVVSLAGVVYVSMTPEQAGEPYTEFYVLGTDGNASDYLSNLSVGERGRFVVGITNHERRSVTYTVVLRTDGGTLGTRTATFANDEIRTDGETLGTRTATLANDETWERELSVTRERASQRRLRLLLYTGDSPDFDAEPYRRLRLWLVPPTNVTDN